MHAFTDNADRQWLLEVNVVTAKRVRALTGVDLFSVVDGTLQQTLADPVQLVNVLCALCWEEMRERQVSDIEFGRAMVGDVLDRASTALLEELVDFFPRAQRRTLGEKLGDVLRFERLTRAVCELMTSGGSSTASPASSESAPTA